MCHLWISVQKSNMVLLSHSRQTLGACTRRRIFESISNRSLSQYQMSSESTSTPFAKLIRDWHAAKESKDPNAPFCTLMTMDEESGFPTGRILGMREVDPSGTILLYINNTSPKWKQLKANSKYEILLFWTVPNTIQYRLRGTEWATLDKDTLEQRWQMKPHTAKILDYYYSNCQAQTTALSNGRDDFLNGMQKLQNQFVGQEVPFQSIAEGLILKPSRVEEWRNSPQDRLHERYLHEKTNSDSWETTALVP